MMALLWVPITAHCQLEAVTGLEFLRCPADSDHKCNNKEACGDDCCQVESGHYQITRNQNIAPAVFLLLAELDILADYQLPKAASALPELPSVSPPELRVTWQFMARTALPVRAPSLAS